MGDIGLLPFRLGRLSGLRNRQYGRTYLALYVCEASGALTLPSAKEKEFAAAAQTKEWEERLEDYLTPGVTVVPPAHVSEEEEEAEAEARARAASSTTAAGSARSSSGSCG